MRVVLWHGWLLEGSGSNIYAARLSEALRRQGHEVLLLCQERHPERYPFIDAWGAVWGDGTGDMHHGGASPGPGRVTLLRPGIGALLPVFVVDEYEGFVVKRFVDLTDDELDRYLDRNVAALRAAIDRFGADAVICGHAVPGAVVGRRAAGPGTYVAKVHGSDLEYAIRPDERYRRLAREGLAEAGAVVGTSDDVLDRTFELVPEARPLGRVVAPGVDERFRPLPRREALETTAGRLLRDPDTSRGRSDEIDGLVREALSRRDASALSTLASAYDQDVPDPSASARLRDLAGIEQPIVAYFGKLIPQKGVHLFLQSLAMLPANVRGLVVGFGRFREWLHALVLALDLGDREGLRWIAEQTGIEVHLEAVGPSAGFADRVMFTGRLDHRYAPGALAAADVLVVPSVLEEAFGLVSVEGAAAGALPLVARHSGLAEVATAIETAVGRPGAFSYRPGPGSVPRIADAIHELLSLPVDERAHLRQEVAAFAASEWSWDRTARLLLGIAGKKVPGVGFEPTRPRRDSNF